MESTLQNAHGVAASANSLRRSLEQRVGAPPTDPSRAVNFAASPAVTGTGSNPTFPAEFVNHERDDRVHSPTEEHVSGDEPGVLSARAQKKWDELDRDQNGVLSGNEVSTL